MGNDAIDKWVRFYEPFFASEQAAVDFVAPLEALRLGQPRHPAKIMMHQTQRLVSLADDIPKIRKGNETLPLLFLMVCAEHIAKLFDGFDGEGQSRAYVRNFFEWFLSREEQEELTLCITTHDRKPMSLRAAIDMFYSVRCDTVHEGKYWGFHFQHENTPMLSCDPDIVLSLSLREFRGFVVRGCLNAIQTYPGNPGKRV